MSGTAPGDASAPTSLESELLMSQHTRGDYRTVELFETLLAPLANCERPSRFKF